MNRVPQFCVALLLLTPATAIAEDLSNLTNAEIEERLPNEHPATYYEYAQRLSIKGERDQAVFWFYAGQLRYRFQLLSDPTQDPSGDPALFASLQHTVGRSINLYAGADPEKWARQIDEVLKWDAATPNGFTSKTDYKKELEEVRAGLTKFRDYIKTNRDQLLAERRQNGVGQIGVINGVYVEEIRNRMPKDWPPLLPKTSLENLTGSYEESLDALMGPIFFSTEQDKVMDANLMELSVAGPNSLSVVAKKNDKQLLRRSISVREENGAVVFERTQTGVDSWVEEGTDKTTFFLRLNTEGELVIQRDSLTEGKYEESGRSVRLNYTFWNRAKRVSQ